MGTDMTSTLAPTADDLARVSSLAALVSANDT
jgi:hypothetical protein